MVIEKNQWIKRALVWVPARLYELGVRLRIAAYETEYLKAKSLRTPVIGIGNLTLGGTGKTPMVEYIGRFLRRQERSVAILTRGYGRSSRDRRVLNDPRESASEQIDAGAATHDEFGDEPVMLARALPDVPVVIDRDRYSAGQWVEDEIGSSVILLDDAYQHLQLRRDLNILLIDATDPFGGLEMVPFGRLREPLYGIKRADAVVITRGDRPFDQARTLSVIRRICGDEVPVFYVYSTIDRLRHVETGDLYDADQFMDWNVSVLCGIGNPRAFIDDLLDIGVRVVSEHIFSDHHRFSDRDVEEVEAAAAGAGADAIITTEKDSVRLEGLKFESIPVYSALLEIRSEDEVRLKSLLLRTIVNCELERSI